MSGVWPWSAGGTTPPVADARGWRAAISASASRSTARASASRSSRFDDDGIARGRTRGSPTTRPVRGSRRRRVRARGRRAAACSAPSPGRARRARTVPMASGISHGRTRPARRCPRAAAILRAALEHQRVVAARDESGTAPLTTWRSGVRPRVDRRASIACRGCGPPSGRFITLMKYGAGATSRNSIVRSSSARTPIRVGVVVAAQVVVLRRSRARSRSRRDEPGASGFRTRLMPNSTSWAVSGVAVGPRQPFAQVEHVAQAVVRDLPRLGERGHDRALGPLLDEPVEQLHAELDVRPCDRRARVGVVRQEARRDAQHRGRAPRTAAPAASRTRTPAGTSRSPPRSAATCAARARA